MFELTARVFLQGVINVLICASCVGFALQGATALDDVHPFLDKVHVLGIDPMLETYLF